MDRPSTSKARGICKYYQTSRGCFAGNQCKFLHGDPKVDDSAPKITLYDQAKTCRYFARGFCKHGDKCWFRHVPPEEITAEVDPIDEVCSICFEKPALYGLLAGCSHVFCIPCLKEWRDPKPKSFDVVQSGVHKKCPMCRTPSKFITPSSLFYKHNDVRKQQTISAYRDSMARVPCRYFLQTKAKDKKKPFCPFGKDCFYQHLNDDGTPYIFADGVDVSMRRASQYRNRRNIDVTEDMLNDIFAGVNDGRLRSPFDVVGRFLEDSRATHFSTAFAELFQGMVLRNPDDLQDGETLSNSDGSRPIVSWPLDSHPNTAGGVRVTLDSMGDQNRTGDMPPMEPINDPRQASGQTSSPSRRVSGTNGDAAESDASMPSLNEVSDSDDDSLEWSDDNSEYESNIPFTSSSATHPSPRAQEPRGRFPRAILVPRRGVIRPRYLQRGTIAAGGIVNPIPSTSTSSSAPRPPTSNNDLLPLQSVSRSENDGYEKEDEGDTHHSEEHQHENEFHFDRTHATADLNTNVMPPLERINEGSYPQGVTASRFDPQPLYETLIPSDIAAGAGAPDAPEADDERHDMLSVPPFTTDGRGRVIAASDEDARDARSLLTRMFGTLC